MDTVDVIVIGAGAVGLAVARAFALRGREVLIFEAHPQFGMETSSRNSEVIHAGIYYPRGSLKARLCVAGREQLYTFCESNGVGFRKCGKLIVATSAAQMRELEQIRAAAAANGVELGLLTRSEASSLEPQLSCVGALYSPLTGIVDSQGYMLALLGHVEEHGGSLVCQSRVTGLEALPGGVLVRVKDQAVGDGVSGLAVEGGGRAVQSDRAVTIGSDSGTESRVTLEDCVLARVVVNCAGVYAPHVARLILPDGNFVPTPRFVKGTYFGLAGRSPFQHLVYPTPEQGGLGVHLTLDLAGRARFGPDVEWVDELNYDVDPRRAERFYAAIRDYWPALPDDALVPAYAGVRPRITGPGEPLADFRIDGPKMHGVAGLVNLFGIESPGLTSSLAIADYVVNLVET
jgi:L-2-hydroxyglutarate oxidase LhgO